MKLKRLKPRQNKSFSFVFNKEISDFHGQEWYEKYCKVSGINTCPVINSEDIPKKYKKFPYAMYYWDYERFADLLDNNKETYWD